MSKLCGLFWRNGNADIPSELQALRGRMAGSRTGIFWRDDTEGLTCAEDASSVVDESGLTAVMSGRLDNRTELEQALGLTPSERADLSDCGLLLRVYQRWGEACPVRIYGDWAFAVWHERERRLFLARDHHGCATLYYYCDSRVFAFASDMQTLLALQLAPTALDELYLAQVLVAWAARYGERTIYRSLRCLPPAHYLVVTPDHLALHRFWRLEDTPELRLARREDYVEACREVWESAVRARLGNESGDTAVSLSGGLDSSAVAVTSAAYLRERGERLAAFTSVPCYSTESFVGQRFGDELPLAQATCQYAGNIDLHRVRGDTISPLKALRCTLDILGEPAHAAGNFYWIMELQQAVRAQGCRVLLTGQAGNASLSWPGDVLSQPLWYQWQRLGKRQWALERGRRAVPPALLRHWRRQRIDPLVKLRGSALHPDFARRLDLYEQRLNDPAEMPARTPREQRFRILKPGRTMGSALYARLGAAHGLETRDPTADARLLAFMISVPDHLFMDPAANMDRWMIRAVMEGRVPDEVRLNRNRGRQAGDLPMRLRTCGEEVEQALNEIAAGPAAEYVDAAYMRTAWKIVREQDSPEALHKATSVLMRGIMAGWFVNGLQ